MQGVCKNDSMQNCFRLPLQMLFYTLRTLALRLALRTQGATLQAIFYAELFPPTVNKLCASLRFKRTPRYARVVE